MHPVLGFVVDKILPGLVGTGVGAWLAFWSKGRMDKREEQKRCKASANYAMFVLQRQLNELVCIEKELNPWRPGADAEWRWLGLRAQMLFADPPALHIEDLGWAIEQLDPNLIGRFIVARDKLLAVRGAIDLRNQSRHRALDAIEERTEGVTYVEEGPSVSRLASELSTREAAELQFHTDQLFDLVPDAIWFNYQLATDLHTAFRKVWPDPKIRIIHPEPLEELLKREHLEIPCPSSTVPIASSKP